MIKRFAWENDGIYNGDDRNGGEESSKEGEESSFKKIMRLVVGEDMH